MSGRFVLLDAVDLTYRAGEDEGTLALEGASLGVGRGEFAAIVGPSGCGKSTILKLVSGLLAANRGRVEVAARPVAGPVKMAGMAFQNPTMLPWLSAIDNVLVPLKIVQPYRSQFKQKRAEYEERARALFKTVGLAGFEKRFPWQLSGGMQQRASLCRALIHEPEMLLLDEPFGALDAFTREDLWATLQELWMSRRPTVILVTHDLREAAYLADRIFVMSARPGRVIAAHEVPFPRPRTLDMTFSGEFVELIHALRREISDAREEALAA
ncbi:MAG TPA: ABC transporter ATP-binding protein [Burkholderiales bacterium]|jgi:NitT/TauT family transport system ATP-binding protein|nr:ABC transporter ATP-binding protein [Burkholderiales bacterium]